MEIESLTGSKAEYHLYMPSPPGHMVCDVSLRDIWGKSSWSSRQGTVLGTHGGKSASRGRKETQPIGSHLNRIPRRAPPKCLLQSP